MPMQFAEIREKTEHYLKVHREEIIENLKAFVEIPSVCSAAKADAPFGEACAAALTFGEKLLKEAGLSVRKEAEYVVAAYGEGPKSIGIFTHGDVVPPGEGWLYGEPFSLAIRDGYIIGRGCCDNKAGFLELVYAVRMLRELELPLRSRLVLFLGANEEAGMADIRAFARREKMPEVSLVPDGNYPYVYGEKGRVAATLSSRKAFAMIREIYGGDAVNRMLDRVTAVLPYSAATEHALSQMSDISVLREGDALLVWAEGLPAHAAHPENGKNALGILATQLAGLPVLPQPDREILKATAQLVTEPYGAAFGLAGEDAVFGKHTAVNGVAKTVEGHLQLTFDIRYGGKYNVLEALSKLREWTVLEAEGSDGYCHDKDGPIGLALGRVYAAFTGESGEGVTMGGGTYARHLKNAFPVGTVVGGEGAPHFPAGHGGIHQADEAMCLDGFFAAISLLTCMILETDAALHAEETAGTGEASFEKERAKAFSRPVSY